MPVIAMDTAKATSTTESANLVQNTYDYVGPGRIILYAKSSAAAVKANLFVNGTQVIRSLSIPFTGTAGTLDTSANMVTSVPTLGGRVEFTLTSTTGTPTCDYLLIHEGIPLGRSIAKLLGR